MQKHVSFVIVVAVVLAAFTSLTFYAFNIAKAQSNVTSAGGSNNLTKGPNMTGATGNTTGIHTTKPVSCPRVEIICRQPIS